MISKENIEQLAHRYQTDEATIFREYFQHLFLSYFYQEPETENIYFKGGTALRIIYGSPRFSEDLDFSASGFSIDPIENAVAESLLKIHKEGLSAEIEESKPTTGGYIGIAQIGVYGISISIHIEVSFRKGKNAGETVSIKNDYIPAYSIVQLAENKLIGEKITALLTRQKPRDFYDFYFLLRSRLLAEKNSETFKKILDNLRKTDISFDSELRRFLPQSHHMIIRDFKKTLEREIQRYV